jgi:formyltetrahydrofolate-dependent phosphoribosylglycinamide formyltransferase
MTRARIAVLASGGGTNLQALLDHLDELGERRGGDVVLVASDRGGAGALLRARAHGIHAVHIPVTGGSTVAAGSALETLLAEHRIDLMVLAGYLRLVPLDVVRRYAGAMVNVHPALLPAFGGTGMYGLRVHQAVLDAGVAISGVTVHFVDEEYDRGTIIAQWPVPILTGDDAHSLAARVLRVEHLLYPRVVDALASGRLTQARVQSGRHFPASGTGSGASGNGGGDDVTFALRSLSFPREENCLAEEIDRALSL